MQNVNVFPGHKVKFIAMIEKLKSVVNLMKIGLHGNSNCNGGQIESKTPAKRMTATASNFKKSASSGMNRSLSNKKKPRTVEAAKRKKKSASKEREFASSEGFGYTYFLGDSGSNHFSPSPNLNGNDSGNGILSNQSNENNADSKLYAFGSNQFYNNKSQSNFLNQKSKMKTTDKSSNNDSNQNNEQKSVNTAKLPSITNKSINKDTKSKTSKDTPQKRNLSSNDQKSKSNEMNSEIDKLLKYYMAQLNENMDQSFYENDEDESSLENSNAFKEKNQKLEQIISREKSQSTKPSDLTQTIKDKLKENSSITHLSKETKSKAEKKQVSNTNNVNNTNSISEIKKKASFHNEHEEIENDNTPSSNTLFNQMMYEKANVNTDNNSYIKDDIVEDLEQEKEKNAIQLTTSTKKLGEAANKETNKLKSRKSSSHSHSHDIGEANYNFEEEIEEEVLIKENCEIKPSQNKSKINTPNMKENKNSHIEVKSTSEIIQSFQKLDINEIEEHGNLNKKVTKPKVKGSGEINQAPGSAKVSKLDQIGEISSRERAEAKRKSIEKDSDEDYGHIRVVKSCEEGEFRQNMDQFDLEYMSRCLGIAIIKHIENGKDKFHIVDILNDKTEKFKFFNSIYNSNYEFFSTFFEVDTEGRLSNLQRLEVEADSIKGHIDLEEQELNLMMEQRGADSSKILKKARENFEKEKTEIKKNKDKVSNLPSISSDTKVSYFGHMKFKEKDVDVKFPQKIELPKITKINDAVNKLGTGLRQGSEYLELDKELNTINEYFKNGKADKYKNLSATTKSIMTQNLGIVQEIDSVQYCKDKLLHTVLRKEGGKSTEVFANNTNKDMIDVLRESACEFLGVDDNQEPEDVEEDQQDYVNYSEEKENDCSKHEEKASNSNNYDEFDEEIKEMNNKFTNIPAVTDEKPKEIIDNQENSNNAIDDIEIANNIIIESGHTDALPELQDNHFESGFVESNYIIDIQDGEKLRVFLLKSSEIYDDDYEYKIGRIQHRRFVPPPDPNSVFEFCANVMIMTKMEKEVIIITMIYLERFIFNTGVLLNSRNWKRLVFTAMIMASKIWDDDSFENNHFAQVFTHLTVGEINLLERTFLELINYKVYIKCSEYFKYFFIIKAIALKYNYDGLTLVPISVPKMMKLQEYAYQTQKKLKKKFSLNNSTSN